MKKVTLTLDPDRVRDCIDKLRTLTFALDNLHSTAARESVNFDTVSQLDAEELAEGIAATLEMENSYTDLLDGIAKMFEEALYEQPKPKPKGSTF
jgi:hypothetical protein